MLAVFPIYNEEENISQLLKKQVDRRFVNHICMSVFLIHKR